MAILGRGEGYGPPRELRGGEEELDALGKIKLGPGFAEAMRQARKQDGHITFLDAFKLVREHTEQDPENPSAEFAKDLRIELMDMIQEQLDGEGKLKLWVTNKTPIDTIHGVDAIVEYWEQGMQVPAGVTLDVSKNKDKLEGGDRGDYKADITFLVPPDPESDEYLPYIESMARDVMERLRTKIEAERARAGVRRQDQASAAVGGSRRRRVVDM